MKLILNDVSEEMCDAWAREFRGDLDVSIVIGPFQGVEEYDCIVSPANSFGIMDGGYDLYLRNYFPDLQKRVRVVVHEQYGGEQPVGTSVIVNTGDRKHPYCAHTPTMRYPMPIPALQVYDAMRAMLRATSRYSFFAMDEYEEMTYPIQTVLCPGLGTATGKVPYDAAAYYMRLAWDRFHEPIKPRSWPEAEEAINPLHMLTVPYDPARRAKAVAHPMGQITNQGHPSAQYGNPND